MGYTVDAFDLRVTRDGLVSGHAIDELDSNRRAAAWVFSASVAF